MACGLMAYAHGASPLILWSWEGWCEDDYYLSWSNQGNYNHSLGKRFGASFGATLSESSKVPDSFSRFDGFVMASGPRFQQRVNVRYRDYDREGVESTAWRCHSGVLLYTKLKSGSYTHPKVVIHITPFQANYAWGPEDNSWQVFDIGGGWRSAGIAPDANHTQTHTFVSPRYSEIVTLYGEQYAKVCLDWGHGPGFGIQAGVGGGIQGAGSPGLDFVSDCDLDVVVEVDPAPNPPEKRSGRE